ncbi:MAG: response regulator [Nitrosopumilaceae archaeon]
MVITQAQEEGLVLIVDTSPIARNNIKDAVCDNWRIETAENGAEALDKFAKLRPSVVTLAVKMPIMDGYETLRRILQLDSSASVAMISSVENEEILRKCFEGGAIAYIVKPFTAEEIIDTIKMAKKTDSEHRKVVFVFSRMIREIKNIFEYVGYIHIAVSLTDVQVLHPDQSPSIYRSEINKIRNVTLGSAESPKKPEGHRGFFTEIKTRNGIAGRIITWIKTDSLASLREKYVKKVEMPDEQTLESIKIFHDKMAAVLAMTTGVLVNTEDIRPLEISSDDYDKYYQEMHAKVDGAFAKYEISYKDVVVPAEVHLYFNIHTLFSQRF